MAGILSRHSAAHRLGDQHEGRVFLAFEYLFRPLRQNDRREGAERLAMFYAAVQDVLHLGLARVGEQAAVAERAGPEFGAALKPADHALFGQQLCRVAADIVAANGRGLDADEKFLRAFSMSGSA